MRVRAAVACVDRVAHFEMRREASCTSRCRIWRSLGSGTYATLAPRRTSRRVAVRSVIATFRATVGSSYTNQFSTYRLRFEPPRLLEPGAQLWGRLPGTRIFDSGWTQAGRLK